MKKSLWIRTKNKFLSLKKWMGVQWESLKRGLKEETLYYSLLIWFCLTLLITIPATMKLTERGINEKKEEWIQKGREEIKESVKKALDLLNSEDWNPSLDARIKTLEKMEETLLKEEVDRPRSHAQRITGKLLKGDIEKKLRSLKAERIYNNLTQKIKEEVKLEELEKLKKEKTKIVFAYLPNSKTEQIWDNLVKEKEETLRTKNEQIVETAEATANKQRQQDEEEEKKRTRKELENKGKEKAK